MDEDRRTPPELLPYRLGELERWRRDVERWRRDVDQAMTDIKYMKEDVHDLAAGFRSLRNTLLGFAISIAVSAVVFALTVLAATGKL